MMNNFLSTSLLALVLLSISIASVSSNPSSERSRVYKEDTYCVGALNFHSNKNTKPPPRVLKRCCKIYDCHKFCLENRQLTEELEEGGEDFETSLRDSYPMNDVGEERKNTHDSKKTCNIRFEHYTTLGIKFADNKFKEACCKYNPTHIVCENVGWNPDPKTWICYKPADKPPQTRAECKRAFEKFPTASADEKEVTLKLCCKYYPRKEECESSSRVSSSRSGDLEEPRLDQLDEERRWCLGALTFHTTGNIKPEKKFLKRCCKIFPQHKYCKKYASLWIGTKRKGAKASNSSYPLEELIGLPEGISEHPKPPLSKTECKRAFEKFSTASADDKEVTLILCCKYFSEKEECKSSPRVSSSESGDLEEPRLYKAVDNEYRWCLNALNVRNTRSDKPDRRFLKRCCRIFPEHPYCKRHESLWKDANRKGVKACESPGPLEELSNGDGGSSKIKWNEKLCKVRFRFHTKFESESASEDFLDNCCKYAPNHKLCKNRGGPKEGKLVG